MFSSLLTVVSLLLGASVAVAQPSPSVVCVAGQCLQGYTNSTTGAALSSSGSPTAIRLLPGQYTSTTNPQLLHVMLTSSSASLALAPGFANGNSTSFSLPLNLALLPGLASYPGANYSGPSTFTALPTNNASRDSTSTAASSVIIADSIWAAVSSGPSSAERLILWDSIADLSQLPSSSSLSSIAVLDMQSSACSPPCSGAGICTATGICACPSGFNGAACETCASGFFGANCSPCPTGCQSCDDGISGSGRCLSAAVSNPPSSCNCLNGVCGPNGQCTCNAGWTTATNGTACAKCADGFFLNSDGNCQVCKLGCAQCADGAGDCLSCKTGFTQNSNDRTECIALPSVTSTGTPCPDGSFSGGANCTQCSTLCQTCNGPTSNDCIICGSGRSLLNGSCVTTDGNGVCQGSNLIADNNKHECDACPAKCTTCKIPGFSPISTVDQLQCTGCLPGFVLSQGHCVNSCPSGTFLSPQDNLTCTACDSSCSTCAGSSTFCLVCANNQLASNGKCVATCPSNTFSSSGSCISCHSDCATCAGQAFNQCSSCPQDRPVLTNGRCLPTCGKTQFFDKTSSSCQSCDSSCSSCSGSGPSNCLACSSSSQVLRGGSCVSQACSGSSTVVQGLGVCLSDLVDVPTTAANKAEPPLPTISGLNSPVIPTTTTRLLSWWEILLMALGCAFIFIVIVMLWRRRARRRRAKATALFATAKQLDRPIGWRGRLVRFGEKLFGHTRSRQMAPQRPDQMHMDKLRTSEEGGFDERRDMDKLIDSYKYSRPSSSRGPSPLPSLKDYDNDRPPRRFSGASLHNESIYSQVTGLPRRGPEPRQPVRNARDLLPSRFSDTASERSYPQVPPTIEDLLDSVRPPTPAQEYARQFALTQQQSSSNARGAYWITPNHTGNSRNPFLHDNVI